MAYPGRTTADLVGGIIDVDPTIDLTPMIDASNELVTEKCATLVDASNNPLYSDHRLELIERWLAAHFYATTKDPQSEMDQVTSVMSRYQGKWDLGLKNTWWGQQAMRLDTAGALAIMDNADNKYAKVPPAILAGIAIGVTHLGPNPAPGCGAGRWAGGWTPLP